MNAIIEQDQFLPGLSLPETETFDDWRSLGAQLCRAKKQVDFLIGDWLRDGKRFGEKAMEEAQRIFLSDKPRFAPIVAVCERFPKPKRHTKLSFGHHAAVMPIKQDDEAERLLQKAELRRLTQAELRADVRAIIRATEPSWYDDDIVDQEYRSIMQPWNRASTLEARNLAAEAIAESHFEIVPL